RSVAWVSALALALGCTGGAGAAGDKGRVPSASGASAPSEGGSGAAVAARAGQRARVVTHPDLPGATRSTLYSVTADGTPLFVEELTKFAPEMQVHYAHVSLSGAGAATFAVTVHEAFGSYTLSPRSRNIARTRAGDTLRFESGPNYLILQVDDKELLFLLIDEEEPNPPRPGDPNVRNVADYGVDASGATLATAAGLAAIDEASGPAQNILYFPPGKYTVGELWLGSDMTVYLAPGALLYGWGAVADFDTGSGGVDIEGCSHGMLRLYRVKNAP